MAIQDGKRVSLEYTLDIDGRVIDSSENSGPLQYTHGGGEIIPGLSRQLEGLSAGDERKIEVLPHEAYGEVDPANFRELSKKQLPPDLEPKVGMLLEVRTPDGNGVPIKITEVKAETVVIDFNHPLAGKKLNFQVKILSVE